MPLTNPQSPGWSLDLLPFIDQAHVAQSFNLNGPVDDEVNAVAAASFRPPVLQCPEIEDTPIELTTPAGRKHNVKTGHYVLNAETMGRPLAHFQSTDTTMLARDSGSSAQVWHSSPFVSTLIDGSDSVHHTGNVVCYLSGRATIVASSDY